MIKIAKLSSLFSISVILLFLLCSNLYSFKHSYWARELPPFIFSFLVSSLALAGIASIVKRLHITFIDIIAVFFFFYIIFNSLFIAQPFPPSDRIFNILGCFLLYISLRIVNPFTKENTQLLLIGFLFVIVYQAVYGILQFWQTTSLVRGTFINPGIYGCFIGLGLPIITHFITKPKITRARIILLISIGVLVLNSLYFSKSRTALVSSLLGSIIIIFYRLKIDPVYIITKHKKIITALIIGILAVIINSLWQQNTVSVSGRFLIWKISYYMFLDHPFFGIGYGNFFTEYGNYQANYFLSGQGTPNEVKIAGMNYYAFNEFLKITVENGIIGILVFVGLIVAIIFSVWRGIKNNQAYAIVFAVLFGVILIFGLFSYPFQDFAISALFYCCLSYIASIDMILLKYTPTRISRSILLLVICGFAFVSIQKIYSIFQWRDATENLSELNPSFKKYQQIFPVLSNNGAFLFNYAAELAYAGKNRQAIPLFIRAARYGNSVELYIWLADCYAAIGHNALAEQNYTKAAYMHPKLFKPLDHLLSFYQKTGQVVKAKRIAEQICTKPIKIPSNEIDKIKAKALMYLQTDKL
ncbi:O-antigen ligase family protein [Solitalea koreensis]|uniref:O-antigen ligase n=1 Tax=Solitalea koreensis TaxID=543615 RepID=A0A521DLB8_9SPHI|nr:O-antigen ligase family protein [Solitalea koreensis]SMO72385.1 O-antigen ligase [Solitalea koreensis]